MTYFITENYLKVNTPITKNVDVTDVAPYIKPASDMRVQSILGTYFYNDLLTKYNAQTLSNDETALVEKIQPVVAWRAAEQAAFGLSYQLKNKGIQVQFGDYSTNVGQSEVAFVMDHYGQMAAFYEKRLISYILDNKTLFPAFTSKLNKDSDIKPVDECKDNDYDNTMMVI
jgi:hypothetical protein